MTRSRALLLFLLVAAGQQLSAQSVVKAWANGADQRDLSFEFTFQYVNSEFKIAKKNDWRSPYYDPTMGQKLTDTLNSIGSRSSPGFAIGFASRYLLTEHLEARLTPMLIFADRLLDYGYSSAQGNPLLGTKSLQSNPLILEQSVQTTSFDIPLTLKLKSDRLGNFRGYMLAGLKYSLLIAGNKVAPNADAIDKPVKNAGGFASYEAGIGFDLYFDYFRLSPEIKIANSFTNILVADNTPYSRPIDKLFLHTVMISLYFE